MNFKEKFPEEYKVVYDLNGQAIEVDQNGWIPDKEIADKILKKRVENGKPHF